MNRFIYSFLLTLCLGLFSVSSLRGDTYYEGVEPFQNYGKIDVEWLAQFLPYNPVIVEAGAFFGAETERIAKQWPRGRIFALEPNPQAFRALQQRIRSSHVELHNLALNTYNGIAFLNICRGMAGNEPAYEYASSLLPLTPDMECYCKGPQIVVPCAILDDWCKQNSIDHIDLLRLDLEGVALQVLRSSPVILQNTQVIYVRTLMHPHRAGMASYSELKNFLEQSDFVLLSHWHQPHISGQAVFLSRELFDAYFKLSLGMYLDR